MSIIRTAFVSATAGSLNSVTSVMNVVQVNAQSLERISEVGLVTATGWRDAAIADQEQAKDRREEQRKRDHLPATCWESFRVTS